MSHADLPAKRLLMRSNSKYVLKVDISKFYPSIYTHSISWAVHGKSDAKLARNNNKLIGNLLDKCVRSGQDRESRGIPIGPDTSLLIAEIILSGVDSKLFEQKTVHGFRHYDDYELCFISKNEAEDVLGKLRSALRYYGLEAGNDKTAISELPISLQPRWVGDLSRFQFRGSDKEQRTRLIHYFDRVFSLAKLNVGDSILKFAVTRLQSLDLAASNFDLVQSFLKQCLLVDSGTLDAVIRRLMDYHSKGYTIDLDALGGVLNTQIRASCSSEHGSEVAWGLWASIYWGRPIDSETAAMLSKSQDSIVALLCLDAYSRGLIPNGLDVQHWQSLMTADSLYSENWLLAYEADIKGWLSSVDPRNHVTNDPHFGFLKKHDINFYEPSRVPLSVGAQQPIEPLLLDWFDHYSPY